MLPIRAPGSATVTTTEVYCLNSWGPSFEHVFQYFFKVLFHRSWIDFRTIFDPMLGSCWELFSTFFALKTMSYLEVVFTSIFDRFFVSLKTQKLSCRLGASSIFTYFSMFKLAPFWKRFWTPKDLQNRSKIGAKTTSR